MNWRSLFRTKSIDRIMRDVATGYGEGAAHGGELNKVLGVRDLAFFGVAAIIGGGIFSSIGKACFNGGPGVILLFVLCAIACGFAALCYAEFASRIPVAGSAYTYAYASFGELFAWIIGWALLMEYSIGNIYVAFAWSEYFTNLLDNLGIGLPEWLTTNYKSARSAQDAAWLNAPTLGGLRIIFDLPAIVINILITYLVYIGIKESRNASNAMVIIKLVVILLVIVVGFFYVETANWSPFLPNGFGGVMAGVSAVFFTYIGFDAVSTTAEECKNPQRDLPRGMLYSLVICTVLYILITLVLTGLVSYKDLDVEDPLAHVLGLRGLKWLEYIVSVSAVVAMTSVLLVFQMGQPRIWMSMSRDGLLPKRFSRIHPTYKTPSYATIVTGLVVGLPLLFTDENFVLDFTSIGTLFAFVLVCGGVLLLPPQEDHGFIDRFKLPYINGKFIVPLLVLLGLALSFYYVPDFGNMLTSWSGEAGFANFSLFIFVVLSILLAIASFLKNFSLIPVCGLLTCGYLLTGMTANNWLWFFIWFALGLVIYFMYGYRNSRLARG